MMRRPIIVKTGTETPDPATGLEFPIPECLDSLRAVAEVVVTPDERESTILGAIDGATILMTTYGAITAYRTGKHRLALWCRRGDPRCASVGNVRY